MLVGSGNVGKAISSLSAKIANLGGFDGCSFERMQSVVEVHQAFFGEEVVWVFASAKKDSDRARSCES
jgi:hypothetical protein